MIVSCPVCQTRYLRRRRGLAREPGRIVRCANCGHTWHQAAPPEPSRHRNLPEAEGGSNRRSNSRLGRRRPGDPAAPTTRSAFASTEHGPAGARCAGSWPLSFDPCDPRRGCCRPGRGSGDLAARGAALRAGRLCGRAAAGAGLKIEKLAPTRTPDGLIIEGDITNTGKTARDMPRLRVALRDAAEKEVQFKIVDPPQAAAAAGRGHPFQDALRSSRRRRERCCRDLRYPAATRSRQSTGNPCRTANVYCDEPLQSHSRLTGGVRARLDIARHASARCAGLYRISPAARAGAGGPRALLVAYDLAQQGGFRGLDAVGSVPPRPPAAPVRTGRSISGIPNSRASRSSRRLRGAETTRGSVNVQYSFYQRQSRPRWLCGAAARRLMCLSKTIASILFRRPRSIVRDASVIDVGGRTLMPGLIDAHAHITGLSLSPKNVSYPASNIALAAVDYLRHSLMDGFTTIREAGGADYSIARLLAQGEIVGPRLFYSGRALTQTGGGADFRTPDELTDPCGHVSPFSVMSVIADGVDEVRKAAREELRRGASQIKLFASGGVVFPVRSARDPIRVFGGGTECRRRGGRLPQHLCDGPCLYRRRHSAVPEGRCALDRARQFCKRRDGGDDGGSRRIF